MTYLKRKLDFQPCYVKIDKKTGQTSHLVKIITVTEKSALWKSLPGNKNLNFWRQTILGREPASIRIHSKEVLVDRTDGRTT